MSNTKKKGFLRRLFLQDRDDGGDEMQNPQVHAQPYMDAHPQQPQHMPQHQQIPPPQHVPPYQHAPQPQQHMPPPQHTPQPQPVPSPYAPPQPASMPVPVKAAQSSKQLKLTVYTNETPTHKEVNVFPFVIGREISQTGITLEDKSVSGRHAMVDLQNGNLTITDMNSRNGVKVGSDILTPGIATRLERGAVLTIGRTRIAVIDFYDDAQSAPLPTGAEHLSQTAFLEPDAEPTYGIPAPVAETPPPMPSAPAPSYAPAPQAAPALNFANAPTPGRTCEKCGHSNKENVKFCSGCGTPLAPPAPGAEPQKAPRKFCNKCGSKNENMGVFCETCGNNLV